MAIELPAPPFTIFSPKSPSPRPPSELRFSRWNNANAQPFIRKQREIKEIEDDLRRERRFTSASKIAETHHHSSSSSTITTTNENFKSIGTPSTPSRSSIPGKSSKYSKPPKPNPNPNSSTLSHPAFSPQISKPPKVSISKIPAELATNITIGEDGVSYKIPNAPFEFQYSYTETPKVKPLALREPPFVPFGPSTMARPWTGKAPLTKKKLPEFDSFKLPPAHKKGVKPVQSPGPFLAGMGPKYVKTREEIMGEPLTEDEVKELVEGCFKSERQLNMGRDGLTHNMLDNIHAHWKRRRVCKIKCKGVCTVDMDNIRQQLEDKTGGKIIYSKGGVLFLYRGRNYNYRTRPWFPLMLWKPVTPVYPRLIKQPPEGLTMEEAKEMRKRGRVLPPICKLGKNGVYSHLIKHVREAFEECELVRVNCEGMNGSDYRKIGGKLQDLVPCVLLSFEYEHILMWRGRDWKSSFPKLEDDSVKGSKKDVILVSQPKNADSIVEQLEHSDWFDQKSLNADVASEMPNASLLSLDSQGDEKDQFHSASEVQFFLADAPETLNASVPSLDSQSDAASEGTKDELHPVRVQFSVVTPVGSSGTDTFESSSVSDNNGRNGQSVTLSVVPIVDMSVAMRESLQRPIDESKSASAVPRHSLEVIPTSDRMMNFENTQAFSDGSQCLTEPAQLNSMCMNGVILLRNQAIESGSAVILDDASLDASVVYDRAVALAKAAPRGPVFKHGPKKVLVQNVVKQHNGDSEAGEVVTVPEKRTEKKNSRNKRLKDFKEVLPDTLPHGSLGVDELAKLLA